MITPFEDMKSKKKILTNLQNATMQFMIMEVKYVIKNFLNWTFGTYWDRKNGCGN